MSGEKFSKSVDRRTFLKAGGLILALPLLNACNFFKSEQPFRTSIVGSNSKTGHLLRTKNFPEAQTTQNIQTLIVGGGISGLSAARFLKKNNFTDFKLLELDTEVGGNSKGSKNKISAYPFAAHYLPLPDENNKPLIDFLFESEIITGFDSNKLPIYNEYYLCFEPQERLYYRGLWQDGLPPKIGLEENDRKELERFLSFTETLKDKIGNDKKPAFTIPLEESSSDEAFLKWDKMNMAEFLIQNGYKSTFLNWYINYCCKDDFGSTLENTSAWAGLHYFCSRKGKAANANSFDLLVWPEGNHFLAKKLRDQLSEHIVVNNLAYRIEENNGKWNCLVYDTTKQTSTKYICENLIVATPQFVNKNILAFESGIDYNDFTYYPWLVANITINNKLALDGREGLSWDNVNYNSKSLGYVNACHQNLNQGSTKTVITYYYNFSESEAKKERESIYGKHESYWQEFIINDLKLIHPSIKEFIGEIEINILGHGMICPKVGFRSSKSRMILEKGFKNLHFAHSDISGISIFEQAFHRGIIAAQKIINSVNG